MRGHDAERAVDGVGLPLLAERIHFNLIDRRANALVERKVRDAVGLEVAHADRPQVARFIKPLHRAPCAINVAIRLMDQVQVDRVRSEQLERAPDGALGARF